RGTLFGHLRYLLPEPETLAVLDQPAEEEQHQRGRHERKPDDDLLLPAVARQARARSADDVEDQVVDGKQDRDRNPRRADLDRSRPARAVTTEEHEAAHREEDARDVAEVAREEDSE